MAEYECILENEDGCEVFSKTMTLDGRDVEELTNDLLEMYIDELREREYRVSFTKVVLKK